MATAGATKVTRRKRDSHQKTPELADLTMLPNSSLSHQPAQGAVAIGRRRLVVARGARDENAGTWLLSAAPPTGPTSAVASSSSLVVAPPFPRARQKNRTVRPNRPPTNAGLVVLGSRYVRTSNTRARTAPNAQKTHNQLSYVSLSGVTPNSKFTSKPRFSEHRGLCAGAPELDRGSCFTAVEV